MTLTRDATAPPDAFFEGAPPEIVAAMGGRTPTLQQWDAILHPLSPACIVAGAGSGKTAVMAARVVYLALVGTGKVTADHAGALPSQILCLTFTNKAAEELARRVRDATRPLDLPESEEPTVLTYHALAARLLDDYGLRQGIEPGPMLLTEAKKWQVTSALLSDREFEHLEVRTVGHVVDQALKLADQCANHLVDPEALIRESVKLSNSYELRNSADRQMLNTALKRIELAQLVQAYEARKRELQAIDYGDQIRLAVRLVESNPEVGERFRDRFPVVLLDEYQDTNVAQALLLRRLLGEGFPVTAVGDPDQNIYAWRGASLRNILRFPDEFGGLQRPAERLPLYVNFRSGSRILAVADHVIEAVPEARRAPDKRLRPHRDRGEGRVLAFTETDERAEARRIAGMTRDFARERASDGEQPRWQDIAILCRKKRLFPALAEVLREEGVPVEVVDLGGLLRLPEVVDVVAWLRVLDNPGRNVALARLLQGPRWRIGYRDMVALARWSARHNRQLAASLPGTEERPGDVAFALVEALEHLDDEDMTGLSPEGRERLREFRVELSGLRELARGPFGDLVAGIAERTGLIRELEAAGTPTAMGAIRNLLNFIDHVAAFSPVEGEASLSTLVTYLDTAEDTEDELEPAQPSEANTVKLLTIHKAKGLEWPVVFVPGLAEGGRSGIFPDTGRQGNPVVSAETLPFELRGDADVLPKYERNIVKFKEELKHRALEEERRLCYVALTRARDTLVASSAYWYEGPVQPFDPGIFYREISSHSLCDVVSEAECPVENPLVEVRRARTKRWPVAARHDDTDAVFPEGSHRFAEEVVKDPSLAGARARQLAPPETLLFETELAENVERASLIQSRTVPDDVPAIPTTLSVSSLIDYVLCPKLFFWSVVRPLPRRSGRAARLGTEIHRWIELQSRGQASLLEVDDLPDLSTTERLADPGHAARLKDSFRSSRFAEVVPLYTERRFFLYVDGFVVGGRIDAIFATADGRWEVVDYKTGRMPSDDPLSRLQLDLYALACAEVWRKRPEDLTLTYFYLSTGEEVSRVAADTNETRQRVAEVLRSISEGKFAPTPGDQCHRCDFLAFCPAGRSFVAAGT